MPSYRNDVAPVLERYCNYCHGLEIDGGPWPLGDRGEVSDWREVILVDMLSCKVSAATKIAPMPPADAPQLSKEALGTVARWLLCGTPDN